MFESSYPSAVTSTIPLLWGLLGNPFPLGPLSIQSVCPGNEEGKVRLSGAHHG